MTSLVLLNKLSLSGPLILPNINAPAINIPNAILAHNIMKSFNYTYHPFMSKPTLKFCQKLSD